MNAFKKLLAFLKKLLKIGAKKADEIADDAVDALNWAEKEIQDAQEKLVDLTHKLYNGIEVVENTAAQAEILINENKEILEKAKSKREELQTQAHIVEEIIDLVDSKIKL